MITSVSDALKNEPQENGQAKIMTADLAQSVYQGDFRVPVNANMPRTGAFTNFMYGLIDTADTFFNDTPEQVRLLGGQSQVVLGGLKNDKELIKRGQMNLQTATRNLQYNQQQRNMLTPESAQESFGYTLGSGVTNYGTMVLGGYGAGAGVKALTGSAKLSGKVAGATSIGTMGVMETGGEAQERAQKYTADTQDTSFENYAPEQGLKNIAAEAGYGTVSMIMEKYLGYGEQRRMFSLDLAKLRNPKLRATASLTKTGVKAGISEAGTEFAQSLANIGIDLIDGTMDWEQVPDRLKQELSGWAAAAVIGGTAGVGAGIYNRSRGIKIIKEELRGTVPEENLERTAAAVFDSAAQKVSDVVSVELELSSELQTKHGAVMDSMQRAIKQAVDESGAFTDVSEEELAQNIGDTSKLFADQVLAEAQMRNEPIDTVLKASDIVYEDGDIKLNIRNKAGVSGENTMYQLGGGRGRGYVGHSMSVNMAEAQANNELPASKAASKLGVGVDAIRDVLSPSAWHHASSYYNKVNVYDINPYLELKAGRELSEDVYTPEEIEEYKQNWEMMKTYPKPDKNVKEYYGTAEWIEWEGTRQHPKPVQHKEENIKIQEKGSFYTFYLPDGKIIRKKIGSNGTYVTSEEDLAKKAAFDELSKRSRQRRAEIEKSYQEEYDRYRKENKLDKPDFATFEKVATITNQWGDNIYIDGQKPTSEYKEKGLRRIHRYRDENSKDMMQLQEWDGNEWKVLEEREGEFKRNWHPTIRDSLRAYVYGRDEEYRRIYDAYTVEEMEAALNDNTYYQGGEEIKKVSDIVYEDGGIKLNVRNKAGVSGENTMYQLPQNAYDTQGKADINTPEFKNWFGDSKVVDENGRPLVVYHGTNTEFDTFDRGKASSAYGSKYGFYFANKEVAEDYGDIVMPVYLAMKNPYKVDVDDEINELLFNYDGDAAEAEADGYRISHWRGETRDDFEAIDSATSYLDDNYDSIFTRAEENGADGVIVQGTDGSVDYVVFEPSQIKSVYNRGTFDPNNDKIYYQRAFAGSRVDYDRPSLEAIGTGEGNQAHGWGLYYALDKDVAEGYRERFINEYGEGIVEYNGVIYKNNDDYAHFLLNLKQTKKGEIARQREIAKFFYENGNIELAKKHEKLAEEGENINVDDIKTLGQVHEVEIPENPFLLDEQLPFSEQPEIVKQGIKNAIKEISEDAEKQIQALENKDFIGREIYNKISLFLAKTPGTLADKETSLLLERYGIKGISYDGKEDGRAFVIFNPDDVEVIQKFYQLPQDNLENAVKITGKEFGEYEGDDKAYIAKAKQWYRKNLAGNYATSPVIGEVNFYNRQFSETKDKNIKNIENLKYLPAVYQIIETSTNVQEEKPNHFRGDDVVRFYRITAPVNINGEFNNISVLVAEDRQGRKYYTLENKGLEQDTSVERGLTQAQKGNSFYDINIYVNKENVKKNNSSANFNPKGLYDANKWVIKIFESADFSTLPHEFAHYWLDNMWRYVRSGNASEKYRQRWNVIANWLNVKQEQAFLTRGQQEKFARGYEQYLLNGNLPTPIIKGAFDDYDRWLKRVYGDMNRLNVRLSEDAVRFFQSMTTGVLPPPAIKPSRKPRSKMTRAEKLREKYGIKAQDEQEKKAVEFVNESEKEHKIPENAESRTIITSNITEGEKGVSRVYSRETQRNIDTLQEIADIDLEYNKVNLEEQARRAEDFVKNNLEEARKVVNGEKQAPDNILDTAIRIAYEQEMLRIGNNAEYLRALKLHSSLQTLRGQEIVAEKISTKDITNPTYWINKVIANRTQKAAAKIFHGWLEPVGGESPIESYKKMIKEETAKIAQKVLAEKTREGQQRVLNAELKRLRHEYNTGEQGVLFQMPIEPLNSRNAKMYINEALNELFGATITPEENAQIIAKIDELDKSIANTLDETKNPSLETWQKIREMNNLIESLSPSPALQIATSIVGRTAMLASVKSPILNITSIENILSEAVIRRALSSVEGGATRSMVDKKVIKDHLQYASNVYRTSGYNVSTLQDMDATVLTLGERRITTQGKGKFREFARGVETGVFKYLMGYPDSISKDFVFSDAAALEATTIAMNEGLSGEALANRATYLFKDATLVTPQTEEGQIIRDKAIMEANVATYTNDTAFSRFALGIRETLNKATGNLRLGDQLMPFVKTPANVIGLGIDYSIGAVYLIPNLTTVIRDIKAGKLSAKSRFAIKAAMRNGLGVVLAMLIAMALDADDYTPEYESLTPSERRLAMEKNAVFNSIRIGDKYISLDYLGPLALPLTAVLTARRREEAIWFGYAKGVASQLRKIPGIQEFSEAADSIKAASTDNLDETLKNLTNSMVDFIRARTIPAIVNDVAKSLDDYERETSVSEMAKAQNSIPFLRENLPLKYGTTKPTPRETEFPLWTVLFGARVKTANSNRVIYEIDRLFKKGQRPTITDVTWSGKLSSLNEADQQKVRKEFARRYYDGVYKLINTRKYRGLDDDDKKNAINSVRRKIINELKNKYLD